MTAPIPHPPSAFPGPLGAGDLAAEISAQLGTRLGRVRLHGFRRPAAPPPTLVAVAHGSRDPRALPTVRALLDRVRALRPGLPVRLGHIELNRPLLADTLAELDGAAVLVPLLFGRGHHVTHDLPAALTGAPHLTGRVAEPLGPHTLLAEALHGRLLEAGFPDGRCPRGAVVLAAAGSRAPRSAQDTERTAQLLSARLGGMPVLPAYASATAPTVPDAVAALRARGHDRIAVASCFTAPGRFATQCAAAAPGPASAPLGDHPALARLVLHRYDQALLTRSGSGPESTKAATVAV
ncbi:MULTISPECIES: sirohydrochlorin chelatase [unclassified Streptomyces]|uniref:sirohydrochlorin chelatase n=1 Tax=unclassified Streptomyces TaxID=2593676 RepID=UPI000886AAF2|nr:MULTISPECIES: sirohydrochlorin chelatase [unclassified Streptomyces]PBC82266.1 sirohydrochlorin ferrochelatase [Streptomyces sp. 2321.6]SDR50578.1 Sirohydrochlorin ferrochelatase [Streptomyces sp. KS_16]SEC50601.1 Sirohydrochlorin ferrochelatase [Streptomyces sp. 2133.1]SEE99686.1 Sirohydrochlorin ferrochelatase [Streptomyces sp. 2112.3]SNC67941.1 Sirohydrochlorin ferrochelatase [Streptomyces sp. 2114.4]